MLFSVLLLKYFNLSSAARESAKKTCQSSDYFTQRIPDHPRYNGVIETLDLNRDKPGVSELLDRVYGAYPNLKKDKEDR